MRVLMLWARTSPALYLAPLGIGFIFYITAGETSFQPRSWSEAFNLSLDALFYTAGVGAACAAWDLGRLRRGSMQTLLPARSQFTVTALALLPSLLLALVLHGVLVNIIASRLTGVHGGLPWASIGTIALLLVTWVLAGAGLGSALPPLIATPLTVGLAFMVMAYSAASPNPMWRNITGGALVGCCEVDEVARTEVWWATLLPLLGLLAAALLLLVRQRTLGHVVAAMATVAVAVGFAVPYGMAVGWEPTQPRDASVQQCRRASSELEVCLWPEYESMRGQLTADINAVAEAFTTYGVERPGTAIQSSQVETGQWTFKADPNFTESQFRHSIAYGLRADNYESCQFQATTEYGPLVPDDVRLIMADWLDRAILTDPDPAEYSADTPFAQLLDHLYTLAPRDQGAWFNELNQALRACDADAVTTAFLQAAGTESQ